MNDDWFYYFECAVIFTNFYYVYCHAYKLDDIYERNCKSSMS